MFSMFLLILQKSAKIDKIISFEIFLLSLSFLFSKSIRELYKGSSYLDLLIPEELYINKIKSSLNKSINLFRYVSTFVIFIFSIFD